MKIDLTHAAFLLEHSDADNLREWLLLHEQDIAMGVNDFGELVELFKAVIKREPIEVNAL